MIALDTILSIYVPNLLIFICIYAIVAVSLNLSIGYTGLINLGHVAFFGVGAYTSALATNAQIPILLAFVLAGIVASVFGFFLVYATKNLKGDYLALATLGFSFVMVSLMLNLKQITRGAQGIPGIIRPEFFGVTLSTNTLYLIFSGVVALLCILIMRRIVQSSFGRLMQATRDDEIGLRMLGKNTDMIKIKAMMVSAFFAGIAGALFAHYVRYIEPSYFFIPELIFVLSLVIVGGLASIKGSIWASCILIVVPELLRFLDLPSAVTGPLRQIIYALILLLILLYRPKGLFGRVDVT